MTCEECGTTWRRNARFCGRCGATLGGAPRAPETAHRWANRRLPRWLIASVATGCLAVLGGVALFIGEPWEVPQAEPSQDVEVPQTPEGTIREGGERPVSAWEPPAPAVLCQPAPCERWRVHLPAGTSVVDGDTAFHVGSTDWRTEVTAIDLDTGALRWRHTLVVPDAVNGAPLEGRSPSLLTERDDVIIVAVDGLVEARSRSDGEVVWSYRREGLLPHSLEEEPSDAILVFAGDRSLRDPAEPGWSSEVVVSIDATTGELRWERDITMPLTYGPITAGVILAVAEVLENPEDDPADDPERRHEDGTLVALDASNGEGLWQRSLPRHGFGISGSAVQVHDEEGSELLDLRTGEPLDLLLPEAFGERVDVTMVGELIAIRSYPEDEESDAPSEEPLQQLVVFDRVEGVERFTTSAPGWVFMEALPDGGALVASGDGDPLLLTALGSDGLARWELELLGPPGIEWPRWPQVLDDGTVAIVASPERDSPDLAYHRFDALTGESLGHFDLDVEASAVQPHDLELRWPIVIDHSSGTTGTRLYGPAGSLSLAEHVQVLSVDPLVVRTPSGTLARFDDEVLLGSS